MDNKKRLNKDYILLQIAFQAMAGIVYGFGLYMLVQRGFSVGYAGVCVALPNLVTLILQPTVSNYLDKQKKITVFHMIVFFASLVLLFFLANCFIKNAGLFLGVVFVLGSGLYVTIEPLLNSISSILSHNDVKINFGVGRACGSASYGVVCALFGYLSNISYEVILVGGFIIALFLTFSTFKLSHDFNKIEAKKEVEKNEVITIKEFVQDNKTLICFFVLMIGVMLGFFFIDNFALTIIESLGGTSQDMGYIQCLKALIEAVCMSQYTLLRKRFSLQSILSVAIILMSGKILITVLAPSVLIIYLVQIIQGCSFAMIIPSIIELLNTRMRLNELQRGHSLYTLSFMSSAMLASLIGGYVTENFGITVMDIGSFSLSIISGILASIVLNKLLKK